MAATVIGSSRIYPCSRFHQHLSRSSTSYAPPPPLLPQVLVSSLAHQLSSHQEIHHWVPSDAPAYPFCWVVWQSTVLSPIEGLKNDKH
ncbi:hypothetical protein NC652_003846 [Populus alba x Populus x berolinensis]|nr:hypothetical protein NC652_003846 [Populus alba x Populus x berolinensis]